MLTEKKDEGRQEDLELPFFDLGTIVNATNNFSDNNKLGQGGFGPVYKVSIYARNLLLNQKKKIHEFHSLSNFPNYKI